ncbi:hypothetical protein [Candidatus Nitrospira neomarina]|uniref:Transmembrane protein n=1 Tax=Candidatus Nitrospira neomarina TaxID=3020899 RepID=A0AA96GMV6_9BACT|nr:hypothetical protein [Candidatus Nitrospira neomarina]WNM60431.1 hypothetical protein PQG83_11715 [Candidatus Nitrospira neomarina]
MNTLQLNPSPKPLKVLPITREAFSFAWDQRRALWGWIVVGAFLSGLTDLVDPFVKIEEEGEVDAWPNVLMVMQYCSIIFLASTPSTLVFVMLAINCHRSILIDNGGKCPNLRLIFASGEWRFFAWIIVVYTGAFLFIFPGITLIGIGALAGFFSPEMDNVYLNSVWIKTLAEFLFMYGVFLSPFLYILGRWSLVFPAIAIDHRPSLSWSWKQTKHNGWRMAVLVGFLLLIVGNLKHVLPFIGLSEFPMFSSYISSFVWFIFTPVEVAVISFAFRELTNWNSSASLFSHPVEA